MYVAYFSGRLLVDGLHHQGSYETSDDVENAAGDSGALVTLVNDARSQGWPRKALLITIS